MCGRYSAKHQDSLVEELELVFATEDEVAALLATAPRMPEGLGSWWEPRWNVAPTQPAKVIVMRPERGRGQLTLMRWGLVPFWAEDLKIGVKHINARVETAASKGPFREALRKRRCLVPADGFYEWKREGKTKVPFELAPQDGRPVTFAGIWERWRPQGSERGTAWIESFSILTAAADALVSPLHDRMPLVIAPEDRARWMTMEELPPDALADMKRPGPLAGWERHEAPAWINASTREHGAARPAAAQ
jgi:putative SOS response-associated peptidase YedK